MMPVSLCPIRCLSPVGIQVPSFVKLDSDAGGTSPLVSGPDPLVTVGLYKNSRSREVD